MHVCKSIFRQEREKYPITPFEWTKSDKIWNFGKYRNHKVPKYSAKMAVLDIQNTKLGQFSNDVLNILCTYTYT